MKSYIISLLILPLFLGFIAPAKGQKFSDVIHRDSDKALELALHEVANATEQNRGKAYLNLSYISLYLCEFDSSKLYLNKAMNYADSSNLECYYLIKSRYFSVAEKFDSALFYIYNREEELAKQGDLNKWFSNEIEKAEKLRQLERLTEGYQILLASMGKMDSAAKIPSHENLSEFYNRLAAFQSQLGKVEESKINSKTSLNYAVKSGDLHGQAVVLNELGFVLEHQDSMDIAAEYYQKAVDIWDKLKYKRYKVNGQYNLARLLAKQGKLKQSNALLFSANEICEKYNWTEVWFTNMFQVTRNFEVLKDYPQALAAQKVMTTLAVNAKIENAQRSLKNFERRIALKDKERQLLLLENELEIQRVEGVWVKAFAIFLGLFLFGFGLILLRLKKTSSKLKVNLNSLRQVNQELDLTANQKDLLMRELNHRVKNNLTTLSGLIYLQLQKETDPHTIEQIQKILGRVDSMASLYKQFSLLKDQVNLNFVQVALTILKSQLVSKKQEFTYDIKGDVELPLKTALPLILILNELITNSIKHTKNGHPLAVNLEISEENGFVEFIYKDNGEWAGSDFEGTPTSVGLNLVNLFVKQLNGTLIRNNSMLRFTFPINEK